MRFTQGRTENLSPTSREATALDTNTFREHAHRVVDWMADYLDGVEAHPVRSQVKPGEIAAQLPASAPEEGEPFEALLADVERIVLPGITHWQHPSFFAFFPANSSPPSLLAEMLTATFGAQCMMWQTSPAATELETRVLDWLRQLLGLPESFVGSIQDSASTATLCALLVARERATGWQANDQGLAGLVGAPSRLAIYTSAEAHSSIEKGARIAGFGADNVRKIPTDAAFAMRPDALAAAIAADRAAGVVPTCCVATFGTTGVGAVDPIAGVAEVCRREDVYLHVDAAWAGAALILPELQALLEGVEAVDSFVMNAHKWLLTNFDCSAHWVRDPDALVRTLGILPAYLRSRETGTVIDYRDWSVPLGRRFRALKLWFVLRSYGAERLREKIRGDMALLGELAAWIEADPAFEITSPPSFALLTFRWTPDGVDDPEEVDARNGRLVDAINDDGRIYLTPTTVAGRKVIRFQVGQTRTERRHVEAGWAVVREIAARIAAGIH